MNQREGVEWGGRGRRKGGGVEGEGRKGGGVGGGGSGREEVVHYKFLQGEPLFPNLTPLATIMDTFLTILHSKISFASIHVRSCNIIYMSF